MAGDATRLMVPVDDPGVPRSCWPGPRGEVLQGLGHYRVGGDWEALVGTVM